MRGCVRVTGMGVEDVLEGCPRLRDFDVSQCKNLLPWLDAGGALRWGGRVRSEAATRRDDIGGGARLLP